MKKTFNIFLLLIMAITPFGWIIFPMDYTIWKLYKKERYNVPGFLNFIYQRHFKLVFYKKQP